MITLDWKERLKIDTEDFVSRKLPQGDFDIDIVYNAYPKRIENRVPAEVISYVSKILASLLAKNPQEYFSLYDYLWKKKGDNGRLIFINLMKTITKKNPPLFLEYIRKILSQTCDSTEINALIKKAVTPLIKGSEAKKYLDIIYNWLTIDNPTLHKSVIDLFIKAAKDDHSLLKYLFQKMERGWLYPTPHTIRDSSQFLKAIYRIDAEFYAHVYDNYKGSRNPVFVEILCHSLTTIDDLETGDRIYEYLLNWSKSGNVRIKKAALLGLKTFKKRERK